MNPDQYFYINCNEFINIQNLTHNKKKEAKKKEAKKDKKQRDGSFTIISRFCVNCRILFACDIEFECRCKVSLLLS